MFYFINRKKYFFIFMSLGKVCLASQEWDEYDLSTENHFFDMREAYCKAFQGDVEDYFCKSATLGSVDYGTFTPFYEGPGISASVPNVYNSSEVEASSATNHNIGFCDAPHPDPVPKQEQINTDEGKTDRREEIADVHKWPFRITCMLRMSDEKKSEENMGTGFLVGPAHILTAGHNFWKWHYNYQNHTLMRNIGCFPLHYLKDNHHIPMEILFKKRKVHAANVCKVYIKQKYTSDKKNIGDDLALFVLDKPIGLQLGWSGIAAFNDRNAIKDFLINIHGYPRDSIVLGDCKCMNRMYGMDGRVVHVHQSDPIMYNDTDTTGGQSGSGVWLKSRSAPGFLSVEEPYAIAVHTGPGRHNEYENRAVIIQKEDIEFISKTIRSHLLPSNIIDYLRNDPCAWAPNKVSCFMGRMKKEAIDCCNSETNYSDEECQKILKYILYNVVFEQTITEVDTIKHVNGAVCSRFLRSVYNLETDTFPGELYTKSFENLAQSVFFLLMRKKIVNNDTLVSGSIGGFLSGTKTTAFLQNLKRKLGRISNTTYNKLRNFDKNNKYQNWLNLSLDRVKQIVNDSLCLDADEQCLKNFYIDAAIFGELALLVKTIGFNFGWKQLIFDGHDLKPHEKDSKYFVDKNIEIFMKNDG